MKLHVSGLSPGGRAERERRLREILDFWNALSFRRDAGETTWGILEEIQSQVTECLQREPPDIVQAERLTAKAALLLTGRIVF